MSRAETVIDVLEAASYNLGGNFGVHVIKNPAGTFSFVGSVPANLVMMNKDGSELSKEQADKVAKASNPGMLAKSRVFKTMADAEKAASKMGVKISKQKKK